LFESVWWLDVPFGSVKFTVSYITKYINAYIYSTVSIYNIKLYHSYEQRQAVMTCDQIFRRGGLLLIDLDFSTNPSLWAGMNLSLTNRESVFAIIFTAVFKYSSM